MVPAIRFSHLAIVGIFRDGCCKNRTAENGLLRRDGGQVYAD
jgi:hypothetical protein